MAELMTPAGYYGPGGYQKPEIREGYLTETVGNAAGSPLLRGEVVRIVGNDVIGRAQADALGNVHGLVGATWEAFPTGASRRVATEGKCFVLLEAGLVFTPGDPLWVSETQPGRATTAKPVIAAYVGTVKDASMYAATGGVIADVDPSIESETNSDDDVVFNCPVGVQARDAVYLSAANTVNRANAATPTGPVIGFVVSKPTPATAVVRKWGVLSGFAGLTPGVLYFLGIAAGQISTVPPSVPGQFVQKVGWASNATDLNIVVSQETVTLT